MKAKEDDKDTTENLTFESRDDGSGEESERRFPDRLFEPEALSGERLRRTTVGNLADMKGITPDDVTKAVDEFTGGSISGDLSEDIRNRAIDEKSISVRLDYSTYEKLASLRGPNETVSDVIDRYISRPHPRETREMMSPSEAEAVESAISGMYEGGSDRLENVKEAFEDG